MFDLAAILIHDQVQCLTEAIYYEARGESFAGQVFVGFVIRNRVLSERYPDGFCRVIDQPHQFSFVAQLDAERRMPNKEAKKTAEEVAYMVFNTYPSPIPSNVLYYHTLDVHPNWNYNLLHEYMTVGNHVFYQLK